MKYLLFIVVFISTVCIIDCLAQETKSSISPEYTSINIKESVESFQEVPLFIENQPTEVSRPWFPGKKFIQRLKNFRRK